MVSPNPYVTFSPILALSLSYWASKESMGFMGCFNGGVYVSSPKGFINQLKPVKIS